MRSIISIYLMLLAVIFSCNGKDDDNDTGIPNPILIIGIQELRVESDTAEISWNTNIKGISRFYYGTTADCPNEATTTTSDNYTFSVILTPLTTNQKYYYKITAESMNNSSNFDETGILDFTTTLYLGEVNISTFTISDITPRDATISFSTDVDASCTIEYGPTISYGSTKEAITGDGISHTVTISGLDELSSYHFRIWAQSNEAGYDSSYSADDSFDTIDLYEVTFTDVQITPLNGNDYVELSWATKDKDGLELNTKTTIRIGTSIPYEYEMSFPPSGPSSTVYLDCEPNLTYYFQIEAEPYDFYDPENAHCSSGTIEACYKITTYEGQFINDSN